MTEPVGVGGTQRAGLDQTQLSAITSSSLPPADLPAPSGDASKAILFLYQLTLRKRDSQQTSGQNRIDSQDKLKQKAIEDQFDALKKQAEAEDDSGGFFSGIGDAIKSISAIATGKNIGDAFSDAADATINDKGWWKDLGKGALEVGKWAAVAASVALAVVSCGAAAPIAALAICGAVLSCAAAADSSFHILEKCGVDAKTASWIDVGMSIGGAVCSVGAGAAQFVQASASAAEAAKGGAEAAKAAALAKQADSAFEAVRIAGTGASMVAAGSTAVGAVANMEVAAYDRDAALASADVKAAEVREQRLEKMIQRLLDALKESLEHGQTQEKRLSSALTENNATNVAIMRA